MNMYWIVALLAVIQATTAFNGPPAPFWWLNTYLNKKSIGRFEPSPLPANFAPAGPCPTFGTKCQIDFATLPDSIKNIGVSLPAPFSTSVTLGQALPQGQLQIWLTELRDLELSNVVINGSAVTSARELVSIYVDRVKLSLQTEMQFANLQIPGAPIGINFIQVTANVNKTLQPKGTNVSLSVFVDAPNGKTFANALPSNVSLNTCALDLDLGLSVQLSSGFPFQGATTDLINFVIGVIQPVLGYVICHLIIEQTFTTVNGQPGIIRSLLDTVTSTVQEYATLPDPNIIAQEQALVAALTFDQRQAPKFSFKNSSFVQAASDVIANWLSVGNPPHVDDVMNAVTNSSNGALQITSFPEWGVSVDIPLQPFYVGIDLLNATITGLNTFKPNGFSLLANTTIGDFTFGNRLKLAKLGAAFNANIRLRDNFANDGLDGGWIFDRHAGSPSSTSFVLTYNVTVDNIDLEAWLSLITDITQLNDLQVGQVLGKSNNSATAFGQLIDAGKCAAPFMYGLTVPFLKLALGNINVPNFKMDPVDVGITKLVDDVTKLGLTLLNNGIQADLPGVTQNFVRPLANSFLKDAFVAGGILADCPDYVSAGVHIFPNFGTSTIFSMASTLVNTVIGGNPVPNSPASVNEVIRLGIQTLIQTFDFPGTSPNPGQWLFQPDFRGFPGKSFVGDQPSLRPSQFVLGYVKFYGIDSVQTLLLNTLPSDPNGFDLNFGMRSIGMELSSRWTADYTVLPNFPGRATYIDEAFLINVTVSGLSIHAKPVLDYDLNELYLLKVGDVRNFWCLLAPLIQGDIDLQMSVSNVQIKVSATSQPNSVGSELQSALGVLAGETYPHLGRMVNYVLVSASNFVRNFLRGNLPNYVQITRDNCVDFTSPFNTILTRVISTVLTTNFTQMALNGLGPQPPPIAPAAADALVQVPFFGSPWNLQDSFFVPIVNDFVTRLTRDDLLKFLQTLGNSTARDILSDLFETNTTDGSVAFDANFTDIFGTAGFPLDFAIENGTLHLISLKLTNISALDMTNIKVIKPMSKFVTETYLRFPGTMKFSLDFFIRFPANFKDAAAPYNQFVDENFHVEFDLVDLVIDLQLVTAMDLKKLSALSIGNFLTLNNETLAFGLNYNFINCFFGLFFKQGLFLPKFQISLKASQPLITISPNFAVSPGTEATVLALVRLLFDFYILDFADITQGFLRSFINDLILLPNVNDPGVCLPPTVPHLDASRRLFNFMTNPTVQFINNLTTSYLAGQDGKYSLFNTVLGTAFSAATFFAYDPTAASQTLGFSNLHLVYKNQDLGHVNGSLTDFKLNGVGTVQKLNLVQPRSNTTFYNELNFLGPSSLEFVIRTNLDQLFKTSLTDEIRLRFGISNVALAGLVELQLAIPELFVVPVGGLTNISQIACALTAVERLRFSDLELLFKNFFAEVSCAGTCSSPLLQGLQAGGTLSTQSIDSLATLASYIPGIIAVTTSTFEMPVVQQYIDRALNNSRSNCRAALDLTALVQVINAPNPSQFAFSTIAALAISGMVAACVVLAPLSIPRHYHLKSKLLADHLRQANDQPNATAQSVARYMAKMEREALALVWHPAIPLYAKILIPTVAIVNIVFLALSFLVFQAFSIDASVVLFGGESQKVKLIPLTIGLLIDKLWNSGSYVLAVGLVFLSGVWPVAKNLLLLFMFFAPKWVLFPERRRFIMTILDVAGKFSFLEAYVVVIVVGGIRFKILMSQVPLLQSLPISDNLLVVNVLVTLDGGMVILCVAAMATLALNQFLIWQHEKAAFADRRLFKQIDGAEDLMLTDRSEVKHRSSDYRFSTKFISKQQHVLNHITQKSAGPMKQFEGVNDHYSPRVQNLIILATGTTMLVLFVGQVTPFFSFLYDGLLGMGIGVLIEGGTVRPYSLMDLGAQVQLLSDGTALTNFKLFFFQYLWYVSIIIAPHMQLALHLVVWMLPMKLATAKRVYFFAKVMGYWASVEVFAVSVIAINFVIDSLVSFLIDDVVGGSCSAATPYLSQVLGPYRGVCMRTSTRVEYGFFIAWFGMMGQVIMGIIMIRANGVVLRDREDVLEQRPHQMWSWAEYFILRYMLEYGAEHHRPFLNPTSTMLDKLILRALSVYDHPTTATREIVGEAAEVSREVTCKTLGCLCSCFRGVESVSLAIPVADESAPSHPSRWNAPTSVSSTQTGARAPPSIRAGQPSTKPVQHHHVTSGGGKWNLPPVPAAVSKRLSGGPRPAQISNVDGIPGVVVRQPDNAATNPIFRREKTFSVDV